MIISETILIEKFSESDDKGYDYLIDNAESDEQVSVLQSLQSIYYLVGNGITKEEYVDYRNLLFKEELQLPDHLIEKINNYWFN